MAAQVDSLAYGGGAAGSGGSDFPRFGGKDADESQLWSVPHATSMAAEAGPGPRAAHSCNLVNGRLYVFGGWNGKKGLNDLHVLDLQTYEWNIPPTKGVTPSSRNNHATFVVGQRLFIHGGHDGGTWLADLHCLDIDAMQWVTPSVSGKVPSARACHTCTLMEGRRGGRKVYLFGGYDGSRCFSGLDVLDVETMTWLQPRTTGTVPLARNAQTMTAVGSKLFLFGGHSGSKHLRDLYVLDTTTMAWSQPEQTGQIPPGLRGHTANLIGARTLFVFGGYDGRGRSNDLYLLDTETLDWEHPRPDENAPSGRQRHTACLVANKKLLILGGFDGYRWLADMHMLDVGKLEESAITSASVSTLLKDLRGLVDNPDSFPDIVFEVGGARVHAHKSILCARSPHFAAMFKSGMAESSAASVVIPEWTTGAFKAQLEFLYTGTVQEMEPEVAMEAMGLADQMGLDGLKQLCEAGLMQSIDAGNVCSLLLTAHRYGAGELKQHCMAYIMGTDDDVMPMLEPLSSEPLLLMEITKELLSRHKDTA